METTGNHNRAASASNAFRLSREQWRAIRGTLAILAIEAAMVPIAAACDLVSRSDVHAYVASVAVNMMSMLG